MTYQQWLEEAISALRVANPQENSKLDAWVILQHITQKSRAQLMAFNDTLLTESQKNALAQMLQRRLQGEPIAYILGEKEFWSLSLEVSKETLIPRPDTEILVEKAAFIATQKMQDADSPKHNLTILDLGTGTGAIALALASELTSVATSSGVHLDICGVDLLEGAVALAKRNAERHHLQVKFWQSNWFSDVQGKFDLIVANPPYIDVDDEHLVQGDVRFEPKSALVAENHGLADLQQIIKAAPHYLAQGGVLLLEHGWQQGAAVRSFFQQQGWQGVATLKDYGDNERVTLATWNC